MKLSTAVFCLLTSSAASFTAVRPVARANTSLKAILESQTGKSQLDPAVIARYNELPFPEDKILAEYVWADAVGNTRSKTRTLPAAKVSLLLWTTMRMTAFSLYHTQANSTLPVVATNECASHAGLNARHAEAFVQRISQAFSSKSEMA